MSKKSQTAATYVDFAQIGWIHTDNSRFVADYLTIDESSPLSDFETQAEVNARKENDPPKKTSRGTVNLLADGWNPELGLTKVVPYDESKHRDSLLASQAMVRQFLSDNAERFGELLQLLPDFEKHPPKWIGVTTYRRSIGVLGAIAYRVRAGLSQDYQIAVIEESADLSEQERFQQHLAENDLKTAGAAGYSTNNDAAICIRAQRMGLTESYFRKNWKTGRAQKAWRLAKLDKAFPELEIERRLSAPFQRDEKKNIRYESGGRIDVTTLDKEDLHTLLEGANDNQAAMGRPSKAKSADDVEAYFESRMTGGSRAKGAASSNVIRKYIADNSRNKLVDFVLEAVLAGNGDFATLLAPLQSPQACVDCNNLLAEITSQPV